MLEYLVLSIPILVLSTVIYWFWKNYWSTHAKVKNALRARIFSYSPTALIDSIQIQQNPGGFLDVYADILLHNNKDNSIEYYRVSAKYNKTWLDWSMEATPSVDLDKEWRHYSGFESIKARRHVD